MGAKPKDSTLDAYQNLAMLIARFTSGDGIQGTAIEHLFFNRRSAPSEPLHVAQTPCFALVSQGAKSLTLGNDVYHYGAPCAHGDGR